MLILIKKRFSTAINFFSCNVLSATPLNVNSLECGSKKNQKCRTRSEIINVNTDEPVFYPYSVRISRCKGSCNNLNNPFTKLCVPDIIKNINLKVFNFMSRINETRHIIWHKTCKCICRLTASICYSRRRWNDDKCRCECKELIDKGICDRGFIWNPSNCECECDKSCGIGRYLDYKKCACWSRIVDRLVEECSNVTDENKIYNETLNTIPSNDCASCTTYIVLFALFLTTSVIIGRVFVYFYYWRSKKEC